MTTKLIWISIITSMLAVAGRAAGTEEVVVFATMPEGEHPEGVVVLDDRAFITTSWGATLTTHPTTAVAPHRIYEHRLSDGAVARAWELEAGGVGLAGITKDGVGNLYAADTGGRVIEFSPASGHHATFAPIPDLPPCSVAQAGGCSDTVLDLPPLPNDLAFDTAGNLYVTDSWQATIFRIPAGTREAEVWFTHRSMESAAIGTNGIAVDTASDSLLVGVTGDLMNDAVLMRLPLAPSPSGEDIAELGRWPHGGLDGIALGASGRIYVTLYAENRIVVLEPDGTPVRSIVSDHFDEPATMAFVPGTEDILNPNHGFLNPVGLRTVTRVTVGEEGSPVPEPEL